MVDIIKSNNKLSKFVREKRGDMSLRDFAHLCGDISHTQIDSIERGVDPRTGKAVKPTVETLAKIAKGTGVSVAYLAALANNEEPDETYYTDPETAALAQELKDNPHFKVMFDSTKDLDPESVKKIIEFIKYQRHLEGYDD
jgi:transcriptional regulator with XRE-family HTH domain